MVVNYISTVHATPINVNTASTTHGLMMAADKHNSHIGDLSPGNSPP